MGSYAHLEVGHFSLGEWKSHIPLEPLLLFTQDDFRELSPDADEDWRRHKFVSTVKTARHRLNARGLTLATCRRFFEEFRSDRFWHFNLHSGREWWTPNNTTFEQFLSACKTIFKKHESWYLIEDSKKVSKRIRKMFDEGFFEDSVMFYFDEAYFCMLMRCFLEIADPKLEIQFDVSELVEGGYLDIDDVSKLYDHYTSVAVRRIGIDYQLYGFLIENDPSVDARLRTRIEELSEDAFIKHVLLPLLDKMGFERVRKVTYHGRNEFGSDVLPFRYVTPLGTLEYYALQAKAVPIHGTSSSAGNAGELISQATAAFKVSFVDDLDNERKRIDKFIIATSKAIKPDARRVIEDGVEGERRVSFLDIDNIVTLVKKHRLLQYLLFTELD